MEKDYYTTYSKLIADYSSKKATRCELDLTTGLEPPSRLLVQVKVLEDIGEVELPVSGVVQLDKNIMISLHETEIETFVKRGMM